MTAVNLLRAAYRLRRDETARTGVDPGNAWAMREAERQQAVARQRVMEAAIGQPDPPASDLLVVCREPCPEYRRDGAAEYCQRDFVASGCQSIARQAWVARALGRLDPCDRQRARHPQTRPMPRPAQPIVVPQATPAAWMPRSMPRKMVSPARQGRIQIEITNFCPTANCSNCSRFCPLIKRPFFMDIETFQRAVDSMAGYDGMLGIMGGEPTLHPGFAEFVRYYRDHWEGFVPQTKGREPIRRFADYHTSNLASTDGQRCGLWTSLGIGYARHYELIQDTFGYQCVNTHHNAAKHQALLVTRRELGIPEPIWRRLRDACWIQRLWSSSITPKGCYPCEIMAALDMLYDQIPDDERARLGIPKSGGWPIEPGWWRREPSDFGAMLDWCELCGAALGTPARLATEGVQDISPWHMERLSRIESPAIQTGRHRVFDVTAARTTEPAAPVHSNWYMPPADEPRRAEGRDDALRPKRIDGLVVSVDCGDQLARTLPNNVGLFDRLVVVTAEWDAKSQQVAREHGAEVVIADPHHGDSAFNKGHCLNAGLEALAPTDWVLLHDADCFLPAALRELRELILNPGCLYFTKRHHLPSYVVTPDWSLVTQYELLDPHGNNSPWGYFQLFNVRAAAISMPFRFPECFCSAGTIDHWTQAQWPQDKRVSLADWAGDHRFDVLHLWHGELASRWNGYGDVSDKWTFAGQSNLGRTEQQWTPYWPVPCRVRRINAVTCEIEEGHWDGQRVVPPWSAPNPTAVYEYSVRRL
jgi:hypothetical protein